MSENPGPWKDNPLEENTIYGLIKKGGKLPPELLPRTDSELKKARERLYKIKPEMHSKILEIDPHFAKEH